MKPTISIIVPTFNNEQFLNPCIQSIIRTNILNSGGELIIVNNGEQPIEQLIKGIDGIRVLSPKKNLGWEGALGLALKESVAPFVVFQNDDTLIPPANYLIYQRMLSLFEDPSVGAVGPETTVAAGWQSVFNISTPVNLMEANFLIFFMAMLRREAIDKAGGIDTTLPGGDDFDLSIRMRQIGYRLFIDPQSFVIHHGFKTGTRVKGESTVEGGWNSESMTEQTNFALIRKHGFRTWFETMNMRTPFPEPRPDSEGEIIRKRVKGKKIVELGCGATKTVPEAIGVDRVEKDVVIPHLRGAKSVADVVADVQKPMSKKLENADCVIARHILEHCLDLEETLTAWTKILKVGGLLIIAVPNQDIQNTIPLNPEHVHAFTPESLGRLLTRYGLKQIEVLDSGNGVSFVGVYQLHKYTTITGDLL